MCIILFVNWKNAMNNLTDRPYWLNLIREGVPRNQTQNIIEQQKICKYGNPKTQQKIGKYGNSKTQNKTHQK